MKNSKESDNPVYPSRLNRRQFLRASASFLTLAALQASGHLPDSAGSDQPEASDEITPAADLGGDNPHQDYRGPAIRRYSSATQQSPRPESAERLRPIAEAMYSREEYLDAEATNMRIAAAKINRYFEEQSLSPHSQETATFSLLQVMGNFQGEDWDIAGGKPGGGTCGIATLLYRTTKDLIEESGWSLQRLSRDQQGNETFTTPLLSLVKRDHPRDPLDPRMPRDEISVFYLTAGSPWNTDFRIRLNPSFPNGLPLPDDLQLKFHIREDRQGNFIAHLASNYPPASLQAMASYSRLR